MNTRKEIQVSNNEQSETTANAITTAMIALWFVLILVFGGLVYKDINQMKEIAEVKKQRNTFVVKYMDEQEKATKLAKDLCKTKFKGFSPYLRSELDDVQICRIVIENTFAAENAEWQKLFNNCKLNKSANLSDQYKLLRGKCDSLNVEVFIKQATNQQ